ncbi:MAG: glycosyltransferase [Elusimicrobiota bacterium]
MAFYFLLSITAVSFILLANFAFLTMIFQKGSKTRPEKIADFPKVSILKPVKFMDDGMARNLESFYQLDYPDYEIIFCFDGFNEEIHQLIIKFREKHPNVVTKIIEAKLERKLNNFLNPKVEMLCVMARESSGKLYWVSDSNIRVEKDTLKKLVCEYFERNAKIVFSPIRGIGSRTVGSIIENSYLNYFVSGNIIGAWKYLNRQIIVGKSMLIEKETLDALGGFEAFREYLAEDYIMGETYTRKNIPISTNFTWVTNYNSHSTVASFLSRMTRWAKLRFHIDRFFFCLEILANPIAIALIFLPFTGARGFKLLLAVVVCKTFLEYVNLFSVNTTDRKKPWIILAYPFCMILKDILMFFIYIVPFFSSNVNWRGWKIRIGEKSRIFNS